ncbi:MAG: hypothetical protein K8F29_02060 [Kofleriaceae bacterium]|nr:hypothetical protein [Candidatus Methylomirabilis lanthanidiphila]
MSLLAPGTADTIVKINAIAQPVQGVEVYAEGVGAATDVTMNIFRYSPPNRAVFVALAEALKSLATDLKKQLDPQSQSKVSRLHGFDKLVPLWRTPSRDLRKWMNGEVSSTPMLSAGRFVAA